MKDSSDCPGRFKCHGPASWCDVCGDVDLVCDDPECEAHPRGDERSKRFYAARARLLEAEAEFRSAEREYAEAQRAVDRYVSGNVVMVARGQRKASR